MWQTSMDGKPDVSIENNYYVISHAKGEIQWRGFSVWMVACYNILVKLLETATFIKKAATRAASPADWD